MVSMAELKVVPPGDPSPGGTPVETYVALLRQASLGD